MDIDFLVEKVHRLLLDNLPVTYGHGAASGDIDNDGDLDIYVTANDDSNKGGFFFINDGFGNFTPDYSILDYSYYEIYTAEMAYVNNDSNIDLILGGSFPHPEKPSRNENVMVFYNDNGVFSISNSSIIPQPQIVQGDGGVVPQCGTSMARVGLRSMRQHTHRRIGKDQGADPPIAAQTTQGRNPPHGEKYSRD